APFGARRAREVPCEGDRLRARLLRVLYSLAKTAWRVCDDCHKRPEILSQIPMWELAEIEAGLCPAGQPGAAVPTWAFVRRSYSALKKRAPSGGSVRRSEYGLPWTG